MPVDLYVIGAEHTVLHLLYSRFITQFLHDEAWLTFDEPFRKLPSRAYPWRRWPENVEE